MAEASAYVFVPSILVPGEQITSLGPDQLGAEAAAQSRLMPGRIIGLLAIADASTLLTLIFNRRSR